MRNLVKKAVAAVCVLSTAAMCTMTSALAAVQYDNGKVTIPAADTNDIFTDARKDAKTQMTTMIVTKDKWDNITTTELTADDIYYINQDEAAALQTLLAGGGDTTVGVKGGTLADGTYVALVGGADVETVKVIEFAVSSSPVDVPITSITVAPIDVLAPGDKVTLTVVPNPEATVTGEYEFAIEGVNAGVIDLNTATGEVTALSPGSAKVKVTLKGNTAVTTTVDITVEDNGEQIKVTVNPTTKALKVDETVQLEATVTGTETQGVKWSVEPAEGIVTVSEDGLVTAVGAGTATVKATSLADETKFGTCVVTVSAQGGDEYDPANYGKTWAYLGDATLDERIRINDVTSVQKHLLNMDGFVLTEGALNFKAADVTSDGRIRINDVTGIQKHLLNMDGFVLTNDQKVKVD